MYPLFSSVKHFLSGAAFYAVYKGKLPRLENASRKFIIDECVFKYYYLEIRGSSLILRFTVLDCGRCTRFVRVFKETRVVFVFLQEKWFFGKISDRIL